MDALDSATKIEERLCAKATLAHLPLGGAFELTPCCNMDCEMCYVRLDASRMQTLGGLRSIDQWLHLAQQVKQAGTLFLLLTGGEPFLYPGFCELYQELKKMGFIITINTNATLLNEKILHVLAQDKPRRVNVTLYGASNETYAKLCHHNKGFDQTISAIKQLQSHHIDVKLNGSLVPQNMHEYRQMIDMANQLGLYLKIDTYMFPGTRERAKPFNQAARMDPQTCACKRVESYRYWYDSASFKQYRQDILNQYQQGLTQDYISEEAPHRCRAGRSSYWITWQGIMTPCLFMKEPACDILQHDFATAWQKIVLASEHIRLPLKCATCPKQDFCPLCAAAAYTENGKTNQAPQYLCDYTDELLRQLINQPT